VKAVRANNDNQQSASDERVIVVDGRASKELARQIAIGALRGGIAFLVAQLQGKALPATSARPLQPPDRDVMTADEVAAFLGVDRNTVYDYAGRGVIPHQRLGKRILFRRGALVSWLDASCKATSTRKG
jgi:excisionase family DNA binding protein